MYRLFRDYYEKIFEKKIKKESEEDILCDKTSIISDRRSVIFTDISQEHHETGLAFNSSTNDPKNTIKNTTDFIFEKDEEIHNKPKNISNNFNQQLIHFLPSKKTIISHNLKLFYS